MRNWRLIKLLVVTIAVILTQSLVAQTDKPTFELGEKIEKQLKFENFKELVRKLSKYKQKEFESKLDYKNRVIGLMKNEYLLKYPIKFSKDRYAQNGVSLTYNAEQHQFEFRGEDGCSLTISSKDRDTGNYIGENVFGRKEKVSKAIYVKDVLNFPSCNIKFSKLDIPCEPDKVKKRMSSFYIIYKICLSPALDDFRGGNSVASISTSRNGPTIEYPSDITTQSYELNTSRINYAIVDADTNEVIQAGGWLYIPVWTGTSARYPEHEVMEQLKGTLGDVKQIAYEKGADAIQITYPTEPYYGWQTITDHDESFVHVNLIKRLK